QQLVPRMKSLPGVRDVSVTSNVPLTDFDEELSFQVEGRAPYKPGEEATADSPQAMVVSNAFVKRYFPNEEPIGRRIIFDGKSQKPREIVGVVGDIRRNGLDVDVEPEMYVSYVQNPERRLNLVMRTDARDATQLAQAARAQVKEFDQNQIIWRVQTIEELLGTSVAPRRFNMMLLGVFAGVALVLATVGLYGVMSYSVSWRT